MISDKRTFRRGNDRIAQLTAKTAIAEQVEQAAVSKIERRSDLLLSTLREYLAATGVEHPRIVVEKDGVEVSLELDAFIS
ncbi:hypothetical protein [Rhodococcus sp. NPDC047139]|uniref:hypothetical protein n=1 Tax=Rhodococcus sp. NPDC047139 TaxID=3155141 RepID=UPI0033FEA91F